MKKAILIFSFIFLALAPSSYAQTQDEPNAVIDTVLETDAKHNLNVAWQYFKLKKAYKAVLLRAEETIAAHPQFSKIDEILYLAGMSSFYLSDNKGKQKINLELENDKEKYAPKKLREDAKAYLSMLVENHPQSKYKDDAEKILKKLGAQ